MSCIHVKDTTTGAAMVFADDPNGFDRARSYCDEIKREGHQAERRVLAASRAEVNRAVYDRQLREKNEKHPHVHEVEPNVKPETTASRRQKERYRRPNFR